MLNKTVLIITLLAFSVPASAGWFSKQQTPQVQQSVQEIVNTRETARCTEKLGKYERLTSEHPNSDYYKTWQKYWQNKCQ